MRLIKDIQRLEIARVLAKNLHKGQLDKCGEDYFLHLERVSNKCASISCKIVGYLHDSLEDKHITEKELLSMGFLTYDEFWAIRFLDKGDNLHPSTYIETIKKCEIARVVKIADILDNSDMTRFYRTNTPVTQKDMDRLEKYKKQLEKLAYKN